MNNHKFLFLALTAVSLFPVCAQQVQAFSCGQVIADSPMLRAGGRSELLGEFKIVCTGGTPGSAAITDIDVSLSVNYSGRMINASTSTTESLLIIGDPASPVLGTNVYQGSLQAPNIIRFSGVAITPPGPGKLVIRIVNMRGDVSDRGQVLAFMSSSGQNSIPFNNPQQTVGFVGAGQRFQITDAAGTPLTAINFNGAATTTFKLRFDEGFQNAFRKRNAATTPADPSALASQAEYDRDYGTESGFYLPALNAGGAGLATQGTRLMATFTNLPSGVALAASVQPIAGSSGSIQARLISTNSDGAGPYAAVSPNPDGTAPLTVIGGTARAVWEVLSSDPAVLENLQFNLVAVSGPGTSGSAGSSGQFAPVSVQGAPDAASPTPRFSPSIPAATSECGATCLSVPSSLSVTYTIGSTAPAPISIPIRSTGGPVEFQAVAVSGSAFEGHGLPDGSWVSLAPANGVTPATLAATINPAGLIPGKYTGQITVTAGRFSQRVLVVLHIKADAAATPLPACSSNAGVPPIVRGTSIAEQLGDLVLNCDSSSVNITTDVRVALNTTITSRPNDLLLLVNEPLPFEQALGGNVFRGERVSDTQVVFRNVFIPASQYSILRITNIRADVSRLAISPTLIPTQVVALIGLPALPLYGASQTLGFIQPSHTFALLDSTGNSAVNLTAAGNGKIRFKESFAASFRRRNLGTAFGTPGSLLNQNQPGAIYNTETGFYNPALPPGAGVDMGLATQGTRLLARFRNIPPGTSVSVSVNELGAASPTAQLVQTDANGAGVFQAIAGPYAPVAIVNGSGVAVWEVLSSNPISTETLDFGLQITGAVPASAAVEGLLGPISTVTTASDGAPIPRFATANIDNPVCATFPCLRLPAEVSLTSNGTATASASVAVQSTADPAPFTVSDPTVPWLTLPVAAGVTPGQLTVVGNPAGLAPGAYATTLYVNNSPLSVMFHVLAAGPPALLLPVERLAVPFTAGTVPATQPVAIGGTPSLAWQASANVPWLQLSPASGNVPATPTLSVLGPMLPAGEYDGVVTFTANGVAPVYLLVHVSVSPSASGYIISGVITNPQGIPVTGYDVALTGAESRTTTTGNGGTYSFTGLTSSGPYTVTPNSFGTVFTPPSRTFATIAVTQIANFTSSRPPTLVSVAPGTSSDAVQTFTVTARDGDGYADISRVYFLVNTDSTIGAGSCHGFYDRAGNGIFLYNDALTGVIGPIVPGAAGTLQNGQCAISGAATSVIASGTDVVLNLNLTRQGAYAFEAKTLYIWVKDTANNDTGWNIGSNWTLPTQTPASPTLAAVSPATATTPAAAFTVTARDANGYADINRIFFLVNTEPSIPAGSCYGYYDRASNGIFLYDYALTAVTGPLAPGAPGSLQNGQCTINGAASSVAASGTDVVLNLNIAREGNYAYGDRTLYIRVTDYASNDTGWIAGSRWVLPTPQQPPTGSVTPPLVLGNGKTLTFTARDANGYADINRIYFLVNNGPSVPPGSCHGFYDRTSNGIYLYNDALTAIAGPLVPGAAETIQNSQCAINGASSSVAAAGTDVVLNLNVTRLGTYAFDNKSVLIWVKDNANNDTGWLAGSVWSLSPLMPFPPLVSMVTPPSTTAGAQTFTVTASDGNGYSDISRIYFLVNSDPSIPPGGCHGFYDRSTNGIYLYNNALTAVTGPIVPGSAGTIQNSQCAINGAASSVAASANDVVLSLNLTRQGNYASGTKTLYFWVKDNAGYDTGWVAGSSWVLNVSSPLAPIVAAVSPSTAAANAQTFTVTARDGNGYADISKVYFLLNATPTISAGGCHGFYDRASNAIFLYNDALTVVTGPLAPGAAGSIQNGQCSVNGAATSVTASGTDVVLHLNITRQGSYGFGTRTVYFWVKDNANNDTGWISGSSWVLPIQTPVPPIVAGVSPSTTTAAAQNFIVTARDDNGYTNINRIYFLVNTVPSIPAGSCHGFYDRASNGIYLYNDSLSAVTGPLTPGETGTIQNGQCAISGAASSAGAVGTDVVLNLNITRHGSYIFGSKTMYIWVKDNSNNDTGWIAGSAWNR